MVSKGDYNRARGQVCELCGVAKPGQREDREDELVTQYGTIASRNMVMRDGTTGDTIEFGGVLCFEMPAASLMNSFPCSVIRGMCDYADSHKSKKWQPYPAGIAAAHAKELLLVMSPGEGCENSDGRIGDEYAICLRCQLQYRRVTDIEQRELPQPSFTSLSPKIDSSSVGRLDSKLCTGNSSSNKTVKKWRL